MWVTSIITITWVNTVQQWWSRLLWPVTAAASSALLSSGLLCVHFGYSSHFGIVYCKSKHLISAQRIVIAVFDSVTNTLSKVAFPLLSTTYLKCCLQMCITHVWVILKSFTTYRSTLVCSDLLFCSASGQIYSYQTLWISPVAWAQIPPSIHAGFEVAQKCGQLRTPGAKWPQRPDDEQKLSKPRTETRTQHMSTSGHRGHPSTTGWHCVLFMIMLTFHCLWPSHFPPLTWGLLG